jgi:CRP/FNR family cyclic AMP-dependent transcriptional regulator
MEATKQSPNTNADRFRGVGGKKRITAAIASQFIIGEDIELAAKIAKKATIRKVAVGQKLMEQGGEDTYLIMILAGQVKVMLNGREIATRRPGQHVGEMALIDNLARRSATVITVEETTVAEVSEHDFSKLADRHPSLWRRLALSLADRLRERSKFHPPPREKPAVFIASSFEGLRFAECIYRALNRNSVVARLWTQGVFEAGRTTIEDLVRATSESDFAVIVASKDDISISRKKKKVAPRDNVIFELGLFMGALSRERTLVLVPKQVDFKFPSDLLGMTVIPYKEAQVANPKTNMKQPLKTIRAQIAKHGPK